MVAVGGAPREPPLMTAPGSAALTAPTDASYEVQSARPALDDHDAVVAARQLGRPLRSRGRVAVRCAWGLPAVLQVEPRLDDGTPFPTTFWLSCPLAASAIGTLEASGVMSALSDRVREDPAWSDAYRGAHERFLAFRTTLGPPLPNADASAGGMPDRVKCLHALYGHHLATRDNPVGAWVADEIEPLACPGPCVELPSEMVPPGAADGASGAADDDGRARA